MSSVPTPTDFIQMTLEEIAAITTPDLIHISDVYVHTCTFPSAALTTRETKALKSCIRDRSGTHTASDDERSTRRPLAEVPALTRTTDQ